jgi:hypothetical protein
MNELSMTDQETILGLLRLGWSARRVARQTGHRRETVARYGIAAGLIEPKPARAAEVATDSLPRSEPEIQPKPAKVATDSAGTVRTRSRRGFGAIAASCAVGRVAIAQQL